MTVQLRRLTRLSPLLLLLPLFVGCASFGGSGDEGGAGIESRGGGIQIYGVALTDGHGSVLDTMRGKVPNFSIQYTQGDCPKISLRNHATFRTIVNPHVYVDGTRATDTCILQSLRTSDLELIEVYPRGVSSRVGYGFHAHGLILLFTRS